MKRIFKKLVQLFSIMASLQMPSVIDQSRANKEMIKQEKQSQFTIEVIKVLYQYLILYSSWADERGLPIDNAKHHLIHTLSWHITEYYHFGLLPK